MPGLRDADGPGGAWKLPAQGPPPEGRSCPQAPRAGLHAVHHAGGPAVPHPGPRRAQPRSALPQRRGKGESIPFSSSWRSSRKMKPFRPGKGIRNRNLGYEPSSTPQVAYPIEKSCVRGAEASPFREHPSGKTLFLSPGTFSSPVLSSYYKGGSARTSRGAPRFFQVLKTCHEVVMKED